MAVEYERLIAYFDGDVSALKKAGADALAIADSVEARFKKVKTDLKITIDRSSVAKVKSDIASIKFKDIVVKALFSIYTCRNRPFVS